MTERERETDQGDIECIETQRNIERQRHIHTCTYVHIYIYTYVYAVESIYGPRFGGF